MPNQSYSCSNPSTPAWIHNFSFTGTPPPVNPINQVATGCNGNANNYIYYTNVPAPEVTPGNSYTFTLTTAPAPALPGCGCHGFAIYIDYNQDGDFDDPGEAVANSGSFCSHGNANNFLCSLLGLPDTWTATITIPSLGPNVLCGQTRMRAIVISDATFAPCGTNMYETQDYDIIIGQPMPPITITPTNPTRCPNDPPTQLTATPQFPVTATYTWNPGNLTGNVVNVSPTVTTTYTVVGNRNGCTNSAAVTVTVAGPPVSINPTGPLNLCLGQSQVLTASGAVSYSWSPGTDLSATNVANPTLTATTLGTRTYTVTGSDANGCTNTASIQVTVGGPTVSINPTGPLTMCVGQVEVLTASGAVSYSWSPGTDLSATNVANPTITATTLGTRTYTVTGTDGSGCTNTATIQVTVVNNVTVSITPVGPLTLCEGEIQVLTASGATTYSWTPATDLSATNVANPTLTATTLGTRTYTVTGTAGSCTGSASVQVTVQARPTVTINPVGPITLCEGQTQVLTASGASNYSWSPATDLSATDVANPTLTAATVGTRTYTVVGEAANACTNTATVQVRVNPRPTVSINPTGPLTLCVGQVEVLTASGASTYSWSPATDLSATNVANPTLTASALGTRTYTVTGTDGNGCTNTATLQVTVVTSLTVSVTPAGPLTLCQGETEVLTASGATTYSWAPATDLSATNVSNPTLTANTLGTRSYTVTGTSGSCTSSAEVQVTVNPTPTVTINPVGPLTLCQGDSQVLTASGASNYSWSPATDLSATDVANPTLTAATVGLRTYTVVGEDLNACTNTATVVIRVNPAPSVAITPTGPLTLCPSETQVLTASGAVTYNWSPATDLSATNVAAPTLTANTLGTTTYTVTGTDGNGCTNTATIQVTVANTLTVSVSPTGPLSLCLGEAEVLTASGATSYTWAPAIDLSATNVANPTLTANSVGTRTYTVTGTTGACTASASVQVTVNALPTVTINPTGPLALCTGETQVLTASGAANYSWSPATDLSATDVANPTLTATTLGTRTYTVVGEDLNACSNSATIQVTVTASPTVNATATPTSLCVGGFSQFQATGATSYSWSPATALSATNIANPIATPSATGTWTVVGTSGGCTGSASVSVTVSACDLTLDCPNPTYFQDFDSWNPITPTSNTCSAAGDVLPSPWVNNNTLEGWYAELVSGTYRFNASDGSCNVGSLYSAGSNGSGERALGSLLSGTNQSHFGVRFVNNTGSTITDLIIDYMGEQWRRGSAPVGTPDRLDFQYSVNATSLSTGTWIDFNALDFSSPNTAAASNSALNGNAAANRTNVTGTITGLNIAPGAEFWIRWTEFNVTGADDLLAVDDFRLTANTVAQPTTVTASTPRCAGTDLMLTANPAPPANVEYRWFDVATGGTPLGTGQNYILTNPTAGTYTFYVGAFNTLTGCASVLPRPSITVVVDPQPVVTASANPTTLCVGGTSQFQASGASTYTWSPVTDLDNASIANPLFTASAAGLFDYVVTGTDGNGCTNSASVSVTVNAVPTVTASATPPTICFDGSTSQLEASGASTYTWTPAANLSNAAIFNPVFTPAAVGPATFTVTGTDGNGCTASADVTVTVNPLPALGATATPASLCFDGSTSQLQGTGAVNYFWTPATGLDNASIPNPVFSPPAPGSFTFTVEGTDGNGCTNTANVTVTVNPEPAVAAVADYPTLCAGGTSRLVASGAVTYAWTPATALSATNIPNPIASPTATTTWTVTGTDAIGCTNSTQITVTVDACSIELDCINFTYFQDFDTWQPTTPTGNTCANGNNLPTPWSDNNTLQGWYVELQAGQYRFNSNDGTCNLGGMYSFGSVGSGERAIGTNRGGSTMRFGVRLVNNTGAPITDLLIDYIGEQWRRGGAPVGNPDQLLFQYSTNATALTNGTWTNVPALHFSSPYTGPLSNIDLNGNLPANRTAISGTITGLNIPNGAEFWIRWTDFNLLGGNDGLGIDDFRLRANTLQQPTAITPSTPLCEGTDVTLTATPNPPADVDYRWFDVATGGTALGTGTTYTVTAPAAGTYTYYAEAFNTVTGCVSLLPRRSVTFTVNPVPNVTATANPNPACVGQLIQLEASGADTYQWSPSTDLSDPLIFNPTFFSVNPGAFNYTVTGTDVNGCTNSAAVSITVNSLPTVTATATPPALCFDGSTSQLEANGALTYQWFPPIDLDDDLIFNPLFTPSGVGVFGYTVIGTDGNGCQNAAFVNVTVNALPVLNATSTPSTICNDGNPAQFNVTGADTYIWTPAANLNDNLIANPLFTPPGLGTFTYDVEGTDANGCTNTTQLTVTVIDIPTVTASVTPGAICLDGTVQLSATGAIAYSWQPATEVANPFSATSAAVPTAAGAVTYTVTGTDANGCTNTAGATVTVTNCTFQFDCTNDTYVQDFNTWNPTTTAANTCANGDNLNDPWNNANTLQTWYVDLLSGTYRFNANDGTCTLGGMYSFGSNGGGDRALGTNRGGSAFRFGAQFINNTGVPVTDLMIDYVGEQWRRGCAANGVPDRLDFQYSLDATSLNTGTWVQHNPLDFVSPYTGPIGNIALNGDQPANRTAISSVITGLNIPPGASFWIRWNDFDLNGCDDGLAVDDLRVRVNTIPQPAAVTTSLPLCDGVDVTLTAFPPPPPGIEYRWYTVANAGTPVGTGPTFTLTAPIADTYTYYVEAFNTLTGCTSRLPRTAITFVVNNTPVVNATATPNQFCFGSGTSQLQGIGAQDYTWIPQADLNNPLIANPVFTPVVPGTTTFTVTGTDVNGCSNSTTVTVVVHALPTVGATATPGLIDITQTSLLAGSGAQTYVWTPAVNLSSPTGTSTTFTPNDCGTTTFTVTGTDANGCTNSAQITVQVNAAPVVAAANPPAVCIGGCTNVGATSAFGGYTYTWVNPAVTVPTFNVCPTTTTVYNVTATYLSCVTNANVVVPVNPLPIVTVTPNTLVDLCTGESQVYTAGGALTYTWSPAADLSATTGPVVTLTAATLGPRNYTVTGTDGNGCTNTVSFAVTVRQTPTVITNPQTVTACLGEIRQLNATGASTYLWNPGTDLIQTNVASPTLIAATLGTRTYTVTGTAGNGCTNSATTTVTVFPLPNVTIVPAGPLTICQFGTVNLTASGAATYNWFPNIDLSTTTGPTTTFTGNTPGIYGFSVSGTDNNGCTFVSPPVFITVNPAPTVTIAPSGPLNLCQGESVQMVAAGANTYTWAPATDLVVTNQAATTLNANTVSTRTYTVVGTAANGCTNTATIQVQVRPSPVVSVTPAGPLTLCPGATRVLTASGALSYTWSPATDLGATNIANPTLTAATVSTRTYTVVGTAANGCTGSATLNVTVNAAPPVTANAAPTETCAGSPVELVAGGATTYVWNPGTVTGATITVNPTATTTYTVSGTDVNGCTNTASVQVLVNPLPVAPTTPPVTICAGTSATITPPAQPGFFRWYSSSTGATQIGAGPVFETPVLNLPGTYTYYYDYRDLNGCTSALRQPVNVFVEAIPQVIGPIQGPTVVCAFKSTSHFVANIPGVGYHWFGLPTGATIVSGQGTNSVVINWGFAPLGVHQISVRPTYFCGPGPVSSVQVELIDRPARPISLTGPPTACVGSTTTYVLSTRPGETYQWRVSPSQAITAVGNTLNVTWSTPGNFVVEGRAVNTCGPSPWTALLVQVSAPVNASAGPDVTTCNSLAILRAANPSPGTGVWTFVAGPVTPSITQNGTNLLVSGMTQTGVYEFEWTVTSGACPPLSSRVRVTRIGPPATPTIVTPTLAVCDQSTAQIAFNVPTDGIGVWSFISGPVQAFIAQNGSVTGMTAIGVYTFRYTVSNSCGSSYAEATVTRDGSPTTVFAGADQFLCEQTSTLVVGNVLPPGFTAQWNYINGPAGSNAGVASFGRFGSVVNMDRQGTYSFEYVVSSPYQVCLSRRDVVRIYRADRPTIAQVVGPTQICGTTLVLTGNIPTIGTASWSFVSGPMTPNLNPQSETLTISGITLPGLYTFRWTIANPPCTPSAFDHTVEVGIESQGGSATTNSPQVCAGTNIGIVQLSGHAGTIEGWEVANDPNFLTATFFASTSPSYVFNNLTATTYIRARVRQGICPPAFSNPVAIEVLPANPTLDLGPDRTLCGTTVTLPVAKSPANLPVNWRILHQSGGSAATLVPGSSEATLSNLQTGTYFIEVTAETFCGNAQDVIRLDVQAQPQGGAVLSNHNLCAGDNSGILTLSGHMGNVLRWESSTDDWATVIPITNTTTQQGYTNLTQTTAFRAVVGGGPCPTVFSQEAKLTVFPQLTANAGADQQVCGSSFTLVGNTVTGANAFWSQVSGPTTLPVSISGEVLAASNVTVPGVYTFRYTLSNGVCPNASDDVTVTVGTDTQAGTVQGDALVCAGSNTGSAVLVGHTGQVIRWESSTDNWVTVVPLNNTTPVLNYFNLTTTTQFRAVVSTPSCPQVVTNHITVLVSQPPTVAQAPPAINTCASQLVLQGNAPLVGTGQWSFVFGPAQPSLLGAGQTALVTGLTAAGSYLFEYRIENPPCEPSIAYTIVTISNTVPVPTNLGLVNLTANAALVSWTPVPNVAGYIVEWSDATTNFTVWSSAPVCAPNNSYQISGLTAGRAYRVRVRANCTNCPVTFPGDKLSAYTPTLPFTTPASREAASLLASSTELSVYPNPNDGRFIVRVAALREAVVGLQLLDLAGRVVYNRTVDLVEGLNEIGVLTEGLAAGVYLLNLNVDGQKLAVKVVLN
jgi:hypothetical protein